MQVEQNVFLLFQGVDAVLNTTIDHLNHVLGFKDLLAVAKTVHYLLGVLVRGRTTVPAAVIDLFDFL